MIIKQQSSGKIKIENFQVNLVGDKAVINVINTNKRRNTYICHDLQRRSAKMLKQIKRRYKNLDPKIENSIFIN